MKKLITRSGGFRHVGVRFGRFLPPIWPQARPHSINSPVHRAMAPTPRLPSCLPIRFWPASTKTILGTRLRAYKRGASGAPATANIRKNAIMGAMVAQLSDADIANIAAWLASLPSPLAVRK